MAEGEEVAEGPPREVAEGEEVAEEPAADVNEQHEDPRAAHGPNGRREPATLRQEVQKLRPNPRSYDIDRSCSCHNSQEGQHVVRRSTSRGPQKPRGGRGRSEQRTLG